MVKKKKLYQKLVNNQKNVRFPDFLRVIEAFGFEQDRVKGSHRVYKHPTLQDEFLVLQPSKSGEAKPYQIKQFLLLVETYDLRMDDNDDDD
ncbi:MAG: type II toxin-antitoxin system HicA family toxin [Anaerolineales bacterium]